eukprot:gnl/TRDRNA2_/TRDRNA2_36496_c0_seq1.p1 gnl/TRDRNA2_/TRDRNA2_36496_c0~~gnl/TRDRNA2_/TRDRNA2_36496_c0_seq1.p1  ORF type:complete len:616 (+),score=117.76 gnl/TRDRNA2_/TRDRNA2_36496_c0_seq1:95-1942(+)
MGDTRDLVTYPPRGNAPGYAAITGPPQPPSLAATHSRGGQRHGLPGEGCPLKTGSEYEGIPEHEGEAPVKKKKTETAVSTVPSSSKSFDQVAKWIPPNPFPQKRIPPKVLQEEDYAGAVSAIIERDFFPDLPSLRLRRELYIARRAGDLDAARDAEWKLANLPRPTPVSTPLDAPGATPLMMASPVPEVVPSSVAARGSEPSLPVGGATPVSAWERDDGAESVAPGGVQEEQDALWRVKLLDGREAAVDLEKVRLDDFHRVFTSEDNASFEAILAADYAKRREKEWWVEGAEAKHNTEHKRHAKALEDGRDVDKGVIMSTQFKARNSLWWHPEGCPLPPMDKARVEFKNTRFTTAKQEELEHELENHIRNRKLRADLQCTEDMMTAMAKDGDFKMADLRENAEMRALAGRLQSPVNVPVPEMRGYKLVQTPAFEPGVNGLSPLMTYGQIASTPTMLDDPADLGPKFSIAEESDRELAAKKLGKDAIQRQRDSKQNTRTERLRALGLTPQGTPASVMNTPGGKSTPGTGGGSSRRTPGSVASSSKITPLSPIGQLLQRAQKLAQRGGRLGISNGRTPRVSEEENPRKRARLSEEGRTPRTPGAGGALPSSITDGLL